MNKSCTTDGCDQRATRRGMCEKHYKRWMRQQPQCRAPGCKNTLFPDERKTRSDYCRPHERLALSARTESAQAKSLIRFRQAIEPDWVTGCWIWIETPDDGYGKFHAGGPWLAHRFAYVWFMGGHARGKTLDHLCNRPLCVRPDHMEPVSGTINSSRRDARAFASPGTVWHHGALRQDTSMMDEWAKQNALPCGNPPMLALLQIDP